MINEICSGNKTALRDGDGRYPDWIELWNAGDAPVSLAGWAISTDEDDPTECPLPDATIPAGGYQIIFCGEHTGEFVINCGLSAWKGETLTLTSPDGTAETVTLPPLAADTTFSRQIDGTYAVTEATPDAENLAGEAYVPVKTVYAPAFSRKSGFYEAGFSLTLTACADYAIHYTLDSSVPTALSPLYTGPIDITDPTGTANVFSAHRDVSLNDVTAPGAPVDKAAIVRAVAVDADGNVSDVVTASYFIGYQNREGYDGIAVVSLVADPDDLFGSEKGIYVRGDTYQNFINSEANDGSVKGLDIPTNYNRTGADWEREANFTYFDATHARELNKTVGIRVHGHASRDAVQKSFNIYARKRYDGEDSFDYAFFPDEPDIDALVLRNGGNDGVTKIRDIVAQALADDRDFLVQDAIPVIAFINGEYWGLYSLRDRQDATYIEAKTGIDEDDLIVVKNSALDEGTRREFDAYNAMQDFVKNNDMSLPENYAAVCAQIDVQSYIDYMAAEIYFANADWVFNNVMCYRARTVTDAPYADGRWRWIMQDIDQGLGTNRSTAGFDLFSDALRNGFFKSLLDNAEFREGFLTTYMDMANVNFAPARVDAVLKKISPVYRKYIAASYERFSAGYSLADFDASVRAIRKFFDRRRDASAEHIRAALGLDEELCRLVIDVTDDCAGVLTLNSVHPVAEGGRWTGWYFSNAPIALDVECNEGWRFAGWKQGDVLLTERTALTMRLPGNTRLTAVFVPEETLFDDAGEMAFTGETEWTDGKDYDAKGTTLRALGAGDGWSEGDGFTFSFSSAGSASPRISIRAGADKKGPRDFALAYSLDGETFKDIAGSEASLERAETLCALYDGFALPEDAGDHKRVYLRVSVASDRRANGKKGLYGSKSGVFALESVRVSGVKAQTRYAEYEDAEAFYRARMAELGVEADESLFIRRDGGATQNGVDRATAQLKKACANETVRASLRPARDMIARLGVTRIAAEACEAQWSITVPDDIAELSDYINLDVSACGYTGEVKLYRVTEDGAPELFDGTGVKRGVITFRNVAGDYLLLDGSLEAFQAACVVHEDAPEGVRTDELPSPHTFFSITACAGFTGACVFRVPEEYPAGRIVYVYALRDGTPALQGYYDPGEDGAITLDGAEPGEYLLVGEELFSAESREGYREYIEQAQSADALYGDIKKYAVLGGGGACALAACALILRAILKRRRDK